MQVGHSTVDGEMARTGIKINYTASEYNVRIDRFIVEYGKSPTGYGGIYSGANLELSNSIIRYNDGYGLYNVGQSLTINGSSIHGNNTGGGTYSNSPLNTMTININNSTISNNGFGFYSGEHSVTSINSSTISANRQGGVSGASIYVQNSILAENLYTYGEKDCEGTVISNGYNILGSTSYCTFVAATGDQVGVDAGLGTFLPTYGYHPILADSPAINNANPSTCSPVDQRGVERLSCDIGAYEYLVPGAPSTMSILSGIISTLLQINNIMHR